MFKFLVHLWACYDRSKFRLTHVGIHIYLHIFVVSYKLKLGCDAASRRCLFSSTSVGEQSGSGFRNVTGSLHFKLLAIVASMPGIKMALLGTYVELVRHFEITRLKLSQF
jgi:hypothetical protein